MSERLPVLIVGGGPVGLSLALGLARCGVKSVVLEKNATTASQSRAPGIWSRTLEIFDGWGVVDDLLAAGDYLSELKIWSASEPEPLADISFEGLRETTPYPGILILPQSKTEAILAKTLEDEPLADVRFSHELLDWEDVDGGIAARVATLEGEVRIEASYLVGCDGGRSSVRKQLGVRLEGKTYPGHIALADVVIEGEYPWPRVGTPDGPAFALDLGEGLWRVVAISSEAAKDEQIDSAELDTWVRGMFGEISYERRWTSVFHIHCRACESFRSGRVLLAGDAAHLNSPAGGQGMNSGIQDAHNLAWKLAGALAGGDEESLLQSYDEERRHAVTRYVNRTTDFLTRAVAQSGTVGRALFGQVARFGLGRPSIRNRMQRRMTMLDIRYGESPLLSPAVSPVGTRAPNCALNGVDGAKRLHDLVRQGPCLLSLQTADAAVGWEIEVPGLHHQTLRPDMAPTLFKELGVARPTAVLLRPDGFIGLVEDDPSAADLADRVARAIGAV